MMSPPCTKGTLAEYDMILSISQQAINDQFEVLFNTPNPKNPDENLIPEVMKLGYIAYDKKKDMFVTTKLGVTAEIECPTVDINDVEETPSFRSLRISIRMKSGTLTYFNPTSCNIEDEDVAGWTVSWIAYIGAENIQDIEEEAMHPEAKKSIQKAFEEVPAEDYLVSSLFCLFESNLIQRSFTLKDSTGENLKGTSEIGAFMASLQKTLEADPKKNPYVLGYGISQKLPHEVTGTPAFRPSKFILTTTPHNADSGQQATLNFCMINANDHELDDDSDESGDDSDDSDDENHKSDNQMSWGDLLNPKKNPSAGVFSPPFIYKSRAVNLECDGVFAVSNTLFFKQWLKRAILTPFDLGAQIARHLGVTVDPSKTTFKGGKGSLTASSKTSWERGWVNASGIKLVGPERKSNIEGTSTVDVTCKSILQDQPTGVILPDTKRKLIIDVKGVVYTVLSLNWGDASEGTSESTYNWNFQLAITSAEEGHWSVTKETWNFPDAPTNTQNLTALGHFDKWSNFLSANAFGIVRFVLFERLPLPSPDFTEAAKQLSSISTSLIMPAGNVYTFLGLDCDESGNVFTHIKYKTLLE